MMMMMNDLYWSILASHHPFFEYANSNYFFNTTVNTSNDLFEKEEKRRDVE
jgi:hypothetical protein